MPLYRHSVFPPHCRSVTKSETPVTIVHTAQAACSPGLIERFTAPDEPKKLLLPSVLFASLDVASRSVWTQTYLISMWHLAMSVKGRSVNVDRSFPSFLQARVNGHHNFFPDPHHGYVVNWFSPPQESPASVFNMDQKTSTPTFSTIQPVYGSDPSVYSFTQKSHRRSCGYAQIGGEGGVDPRSIFHSDHHFTHETLHHGLPVPTAETYYPFRPTEPTPSTTFAAIPGPIKIDTSPLLPITTVLPPKVLPGEVDVTKYEPVEMEEWLDTPNEYTAWTPETANSPTDEAPSTPPSFGYVGGSWRRPSTYSDQNDNIMYAFTPNSLQAALEKTHPERLGVIPHPSGPISMNGRLYPTPEWAFAHRHIEPAQIAPAHLASNRLQPAQASASPRDLEHPVFIERPSSSYSTTSASSAPVSEDEQSAAPTPAPKPLPALTAHTKRNELLVDLRNQGHSYKDIKRIGRFREAESTLRGRVRMLTKEKWERVRKPQWKQADLALLRRAVAHFRHEAAEAPKGRKSKQKIPWKKVGEWLQEHGSSYTFAPATCARKWEEMSG